MVTGLAVVLLIMIIGVPYADKTTKKYLIYWVLVLTLGFSIGVIVERSLEKDLVITPIKTAETSEQIDIMDSGNYYEEGNKYYYVLTSKDNSVKKFYKPTTTVEEGEKPEIIMHEMEYLVSTESNWLYRFVFGEKVQNQVTYRIVVPKVE